MTISTPQGGNATYWHDIRHIQLHADRAVQVVTTTSNLILYCDELQYVATLLIGALRHYTQRTVPPPPPNKRLGPRT